MDQVRILLSSLPYKSMRRPSLTVNLQATDVLDPGHQHTAVPILILLFKVCVIGGRLQHDDVWPWH